MKMFSLIKFSRMEREIVQLYIEFVHLQKIPHLQLNKLKSYPKGSKVLGLVLSER